MPRRLSALATLARIPLHLRATPEQIRAVQEGRLRQVVEHAYERVEYYRRLLDTHSISPHEIRSLDDLAKLPLTGRADLQGQPETDLIARGLDPERLVTRTTSGSQGRPFTVRRTWLEERLLNAFRRRAMHSFGTTRTDHWALIQLNALRHPLSSRGPLRLLRRLGLYRSDFLSCLDPPHEIAEALRTIQPDVIKGYAGLLTQVADVLARDGGVPVRPRVVVAGAEVLTDAMRRRIERGFGVRPFDLFGCHELNLIAWECTQTGLLHTCDDLAIVEVLRDGRPAEPGESGEVVVTSLHSLAMPFIRYRLGDVAVRGEARCSCGLPFSTLRSVQGRMLDYFELPGRRLVHPYEVTRTFRDDAGWIRQFQLVQERPDQMLLRAVPFESPTPEQVSRVLDDVGRVLGTGVDIRVELVADLPPERSGKFRVARSLVSSLYEDDGADVVEPNRS